MNLLRSSLSALLILTALVSFSAPPDANAQAPSTQEFTVLAHDYVDALAAVDLAEQAIATADLSVARIKAELLDAQAVKEAKLEAKSTVDAALISSKNAIANAVNAGGKPRAVRLGEERILVALPGGTVELILIE